MLGLFDDDHVRAILYSVELLMGSRIQMLLDI